MKFVDSIFRDFTWVIVIICFFLAYYLAYFLSPIYLSPYIHYYLQVASSHTSVFNLVMFIIFVSSPFNAYETKLIHANLVMYFIESALLPTVLLFILLIIYRIAMALAKVKPMIRPIDFTRFTMLASLADSWLVSLIRWLWLGAPSIGISVFTTFWFIAIFYIMIQLAGIIRLARVSPKALLNTMYILIIIVIALTALLTFTEIIPIMNINHLIGLMIAISFIYSYHKLNIRHKLR